MKGGVASLDISRHERTHASFSHTRKKEGREGVCKFILHGPPSTKRKFNAKAARVAQFANGVQSEGGRETPACRYILKRFTFLAKHSGKKEVLSGN